MKVIKINNCYYSVPSNEKTDLYTKVIPAIKGIFLTEDKVQILDKPIEGIKISIIKLEKVVNLLFDVTEILITKKDHVEQTLVIFKNIETQEIYGYYILPEGNKIFYNNSLTNLTREYYDEKNYPQIKKLVKIVGNNSLSSNEIFRIEVAKRIFGLETPLNCTFIQSMLKSPQLESDLEKLYKIAKKIITDNITKVTTQMLIDTGLTSSNIEALKTVLLDLNSDIVFLLESELVDGEWILALQIRF